MADYIRIYFPNTPLYNPSISGSLIDLFINSLTFTLNPPLLISILPGQEIPSGPNPITQIQPNSVYVKEFQLSGTIPISTIVVSALDVVINKNSEPYPSEISMGIEFLFKNGPSYEPRSPIFYFPLFINGNITQKGQRYTGNAGVEVDGSCFVEDTRILTDKGYVNVQDLKRDDIVVTHDNRHVLIKSVICLPAVSSPSTDPFLYKANCFSENYPPIDTYLSPHHSILINNRWDVKGRSEKDVWTNGAHLKHNNLLNESIKQVKIADHFNYYHLYLPDFKTDHLVINNGLVVESYGIDYYITHTPFQDDPRVFTIGLEKKPLDV